MKIIIPEIDKNIHLYLGFLGNHSEEKVIDKLIDWFFEEKTGNYFNDLCVDEHKEIAKRFLITNHDNEEVMDCWHKLMVDKYVNFF